MAPIVKNMLAMYETQIRSLGWADPLEKEMATHSSILAWEIPWTEEPGRLQSMGSQRVRHNLATKQQLNLNMLCGRCVQLPLTQLPCPPPGDLSQPRD